MNLVKYFLKNKPVTILLLSLIFFGGIFAYIKMGKLEDAPFTIKQALVVTSYPGASPSEVQKQVTDPLEEAIQSLDELYYLKTENRAGLSKITLLLSMIKKLRPDWEIFVLEGSIEGAIKWFNNNKHPDILFLDVHLSDGNSFEFLSQVKPSSAIIFTTAYDEYAIRAFSVNSIDYILKPVDIERLSESIEKYERIFNSREQRQPEYLNIILENLNNRDKPFRTRFLISGVDKFYTLLVDDISYFYSENRISFAVTKSGKEHIVDLSLNKLMDQLNPDKFFRANRQISLGIDSIVNIQPYFNNRIVVVTKPNHKSQIIISEEKIQAFKMWLNY